MIHSILASAQSMNPTVIALCVMGVITITLIRNVYALRTHA